MKQVNEIFADNFKKKTKRTNFLKVKKTWEKMCCKLATLCKLIKSETY